MTSSPRAIRGTPAVLLAAVLVGSACSTYSDNERNGRSIAEIANELADVAETRADLRHVRAYVHAVNELAARDGRRYSTAAIATELEHQLLLALHSRFNVVDTELSKPDPDAGRDPLLAADFYQATHLLIGDFARDGDELMLCLRLVDADSKLIVAASEGSVPFLNLSDDARASSRTPVWQRPSYVWRRR